MIYDLRKMNMSKNYENL
eukprot:Gb_35499 [translate_table: standard]